MVVPIFDTKALLEKWFGKTWQYEKRNELLASFAKELIDDTLYWGRYYQSQNSKDITEKNLLFAYFNYEWIYQSKLLLVLVRDILLEQQKGIIYLLDQKIQESELIANWQKSVDLLRQANIELTANSSPQKIKQLWEKEHKKWKHEENPWLVYEEQFLQLKQQFQLLAQSHQSMLSLHQLFDNMRQYMEHTLKDCNVELKAILKKIDSLLKLESCCNTIDYIGILSDHIHLLTKDYDKGYNTIFSEKIDLFIAPYNVVFELVVATNSGLLEERVLNPQKKIEAWLDSEILPLFYEIWEVGESVRTGMKMIVINLKNHLQALQQEKGNIPLKDIAILLHPLQTFKKDIIATTQNMTEITESIAARLDEQFILSLLFDTQQYFLPVSLQSVINQKFWQHESWFSARVKNAFDLVSSKLKAIQHKVAYQHTLSISEKIAFCIQSRYPDPQNIHYTSIFQTKGYVGDSFFVGREIEMARAEQMINLWRSESIRGAILVSGSRFVGKTIFVEGLIHRFFQNQAIRLVPNTSIDIGGRKSQLSYDLGQALDLLCKQQQGLQSLVVIDDLEQWWDAKIPLYANIKALTQTIDRYANKVFFIVIVNDKNKENLYRLTPAERVFQAEINLNYTSKQILQQAIWIRHGATHKKLIDNKGEILSLKSFSKLVNRIHQFTNGNIGEALNVWANSTYFVDDNHVKSKLNSYGSLPNFFNEESKLILELVLIYKSINEYQLNLLLGPAFKKRYATVVRRLLNTGILVRQLDSSIEINYFIVNDLARLLG